MSRHEHPALKAMYEDGIPSGEVTELTATGITITGAFNPGLAVSLHPGAQVFVLTEDDVIDLASTSQAKCEGCQL